MRIAYVVPIQWRMIDTDVKNAKINYESLQESRNSRSQSAPSASVNTERVTLLSFVVHADDIQNEANGLLGIRDYLF
ncbi:hypothetical protein Tco_1578429 [Tanacetum coccineum]